MLRLFAITCTEVEPLFVWTIAHSDVTDELQIVFLLFALNSSSRFTRTYIARERERDIKKKYSTIQTNGTNKQRKRKEKFNGNRLKGKPNSMIDNTKRKRKDAEHTKKKPNRQIIKSTWIELIHADWLCNTDTSHWIFSGLVKTQRLPNNNLCCVKTFRKLTANNFCQFIFIIRRMSMVFFLFIYLAYSLHRYRFAFNLVMTCSLSRW